MRSRHTVEHKFCTKKYFWDDRPPFSHLENPFSNAEEINLAHVCTCVFLLKQSDFRSSVLLKIHAVTTGTLCIYANR